LLGPSEAAEGSASRMSQDKVVGRELLASHVCHPDVEARSTRSPFCSILSERHGGQDADTRNAFDEAPINALHETSRYCTKTHAHEVCHNLFLISTEYSRLLFLNFVCTNLLATPRAEVDLDDPLDTASGLSARDTLVDRAAGRTAVVPDAEAHQ